jgi:RimJ/RimL family protein N-acetyltransferase
MYENVLVPRGDCALYAVARHDERGGRAKPHGAHDRLAADARRQTSSRKAQRRRAIGFAGVERIDAETCGETGIALGPAYVRRGYGRQIVTALCRYCRETYGARYFRYCAREKNAASRALAVSLGFAQTGAEDRTDERDGLPYRIVVYQKEI